MSATSGKIGFGTLFKILVSASYQSIGQQTKVKPYGVKVDSIDATHEESPNAWKEFIPGLKDGDQATSEIHYNPGGAEEALLLSIVGTIQTVRIMFANGAHADFSAFITDMSPDTPLDGKMVCALTWKVSGQVTVTAAAAPTNSTLPAVSGLPKVGVVLTAFNGLWANEPTAFTYQWKLDGSNISGAIGPTYTPVSGDISHTVTVAVTGTNSAGTATATSVGSLAVVA